MRKIRPKNLIWRLASWRQKRWRLAAITCSADIIPCGQSVSQSVQEFRTTEQTPEALYRLMECYLSLGLRGEAQSAAAILQASYSSTQWHSDSLICSVARVCFLMRVGKTGCPPSTDRRSRANGCNQSEAAMLRGLSVRDILIIDHLELEFQPGLNVLTPGKLGRANQFCSIALALFGMAWSGGARAPRGRARRGGCLV